MVRLVATLSLAFLPLLSSVFAQDRIYKVAYSITATDSIKSEVTSYIGRELRALGDVEIVESKADWELAIIAIELETMGGTKTGVALSAMATRPFSSEYLMGLVKDEYKKAAQALTSDLYYKPGIWIQVGAPRDLRIICSKVVATFDSDALESDRRAWRELQRARDGAGNKE